MFVRVRIMPQRKKFIIKNSQFALKNIRGFTLIELLVALGIMAILTVVALASYGSFATRQQVKNAALELQTNLRKYQAFALNGQKKPDPANAGCYHPDPTYTPNPPGDPITEKISYYNFSLIANGGAGSTKTFRAELVCNPPVLPVVTLSPITVLKSLNAVEVWGRTCTSNPCPDPFIQCTNTPTFEIIKFYPLTRLADFFCTAVGLNSPITSPAEIYIKISGAGVIYRVHVTDQGQIYVEKV
jgi:prepilin-type N-terminal cleavage/methylation domain-containing protein